jgi:chorismate synthase
MALSEADIQGDLDRRRPGTSRHVTQRNEPDTVEILSGVYEGKTTGTPICLLIRNTDQRSKDYSDIAQTFRPGHADYTYCTNTACATRAAAGVVRAPDRAHGGGRCRGQKMAAEPVRHHLSRLHDADGEDRHPVRAGTMCPTTRFCAGGRCEPLEAYMDSLRKAGDSCGARMRVTASNVPVGLGEPLFDKLDADIAYAMMGINAVKGVEIGAGFASVTQRGTMHGDSLSRRKASNQQRRRCAGRHQHRAGPGRGHCHQAHQFHHQPARDHQHPGEPPRWSPRAATTPAWASAPRRLPKPCWRWW